MVYDEQPLALLGSVDSASTHLAEQVVAKANLPLVSPIATDKSVTLAGVSWMFSCAPSDAAIARVLVDDILATLADAGDSPAGSRRGDEARTGKSEIDQSLTSAATGRENTSRLALLACTDHESRMLTREVLRECSRRGRMPDFRFNIPPGALDFARQMEGMVEAKPATVLIVAGAEDAARWVKAVREKAPAVQVFGSQAMGRARFRELAGPTAEGVRFPLLFVPDAAGPKAAQFIERFAADRRRPPDYTAVLTYDATRLLLEAIRRAGPNRARIREALTQLSPWPGLAGPIRFDGTGQNMRTDICMGIIRSGAVVSLRPSGDSQQTVRLTPHP
jgi:branched-chain amino acid transport system substrate-binding protein